MVSFLPQLVLKLIYGTTTGFDPNFRLVYLFLAHDLFTYFTWRHAAFLNYLFPVGISSLCRSQPINSFEWGTDTVISVRFNPGEPNLLATSARYLGTLVINHSFCWYPWQKFNFFFFINILTFFFPLLLCLLFADLIEFVFLILISCCFLLCFIELIFCLF